MKRNDITVSDLMNEYMESNKDKWTPKYYKTNKGWVKNIKNSIGHICLQNLNVKILESFYNELKNIAYIRIFLIVNLKNVLMLWLIF